MKLTDADRVALFVAALPAVIALKLTTSPPAKDGSTKKVSIDFAAAVWTKRYVETLAKVIEEDGRGSSDAGGFPS